MSCQYAGAGGGLAIASPKCQYYRGQYYGGANFPNNNSHFIDLGIRRDTASAEFRWTPTTDWDVKVDYSRMRREGTQPQAAVTFWNTQNLSTTAGSTASLSQNRVVLELPKPVKDTTHNVNASGEYAGTTPWDKKFNVTLAYGASIYRDDFDAFTFVNPWSNGTWDIAGTPTTNANFTFGTPFINQMSTPPSNTAQNVRVSGGVDLPWNSRYTGTVQYTLMQQDSAFLPFSRV